MNMTAPIAFFNLGALELLILLVVGLLGLGVIAALGVGLMLISRRQPPEEGDSRE